MASKKSPYQNFMQDRYGADELGIAIALFALALIVINLFVNSWGLTWVIVVLTALQFCRLLSHNYDARRAENNTFLRLIKNPKNALGDLTNRFQRRTQEAKTYKHLSCPNCKQKVRVPRGKGKLRVTCPSCKTKFDARS